MVEKMQSFKEMTIRKPPSYTLPKLELNGKWLETLGFTVGTLVNVMHQDSCITLSVNAPPRNGSTVICVTSKLISKKPRTVLTIDGFLLKRYGFNVGDRIVLHLTPYTIQITRINNFITDEISQCSA